MSTASDIRNRYNAVDSYIEKGPSLLYSGRRADNSGNAGTSVKIIARRALRTDSGRTPGNWTARDSTVRSRGTRTRDRKQKLDAGQRCGGSCWFLFAVDVAQCEMRSRWSDRQTDRQTDIQ